MPPMNNTVSGPPPEDDATRAIHQIDEKFFWEIYHRPPNTAGFLRNFLSPNLTGMLDLDFIIVSRKSYLSESWRAHYTDLVVKTRFKADPQKPAYVYFLLEHKSYSPLRPAFQMLRYMVEQWHDLEKQGRLGPLLPPIFPILIYHGEAGWTHGLHFHDIVNLPHADMKPYIPNFQYLLSEAAHEDENRYQSAVVVKCWFMVVKYANSAVMREKLIELVRLLHDNLSEAQALEYVEIFFKYLAATATAVTKSEAVAAVETFFKGRGETMIRGWAKEDVEKGMLLDAREMVLEALGLKFERFITPDIQEQIQHLENRQTLKRLHRAAILSPNLDSFRRDMREAIDNEQRAMSG